MNVLELFEQYPNAKAVIKEWFLKEMISSSQNETVPEEFKQAVLQTGISDENLATLIEVQPRVLFDVFDENNIIIIIKHHNLGFTYAVEEADQNDFFKTRKEAELEAIDTAFGILEDSIKTEL
tara:strand:+ start:36909 stop:37277 length:369 start_codon:yes stop_codon:yes gene_type:complete